MIPPNKLNQILFCNYNLKRKYSRIYKVTRVCDYNTFKVTWACNHNTKKRFSRIKWIINVGYIDHIHENNIKQLKRFKRSDIQVNYFNHHAIFILALNSI